MGLLEKKYVAISHNGIYYSFNDIESWIESNGKWLFEKMFGFDHCIVRRNQYFNMLNNAYENNICLNSYDRSYTLSSNNEYAYLFQYVIMDLNGKAIDPRILLREYEEKHPVIARKVFTRGRDWQRKLIARYRHKDVDHRMLKAFHGVVAEDGELLLKRNFLFTAPYDDCREKICQRSWKKFRRNQYK
jgi:hypothetical protein